MSWRSIVPAVAVAGALPAGVGALPFIEHARYAQHGVRVDAIVVDAERLWLRELLYPVPKRQIYRLRIARLGRWRLVRLAAPY